MKLESKITDRIIRLKKILEPYNKPRILYTGYAIFGAIILIFVYWPLISKLDMASKNLNELQSELLNHHGTIASLGNLRANSKVMRQNEVPPAIAELTEKGRSLGLHFSSISPGQLQETEQAGIQKSPISFAIESEYRSLGQFLEYIEELPCGVMEIKSISLHSGKENSSKLTTELVLDLYVEVENET